MRCPSCEAAVAVASRFCPECGAAIARAGDTDTQTIAKPRPKAPSSSSASEEGRFAVGSILAERYRVLGLVGHGGMGEVYRATDLKLSQPVALKFLPEATARNARLLTRFHGEVRIARQVSHPNVCRVYDIGEVDGAAYISMEYVDGEDLGSLLRRIGRLPGDKAIEIARKLVRRPGRRARQGRAAPRLETRQHHDRRPGPGADHGLRLGRPRRTSRRSGDPQRHACLHGARAASRKRSFGSQRYLRARLGAARDVHRQARLSRRRSSAVPTPPTTVKDIDPMIERVILAVSMPIRANRPASALALALHLPGGDPLAAALAAGETPTPGMVAAAGDTEGISVKAAGIAWALSLPALVAVAVLGE